MDILNISIFTDGNVKMGLGNVYRTISLANQLKKYAKIKFLTTSDDEIISKIKKNNFGVFQGKNINAIEGQAKMDKPEILIIDKLDVNESFCENIKKSFNPKIVIFGNTTSANKFADVVINAIIGTNYKNRSYVDKYNRTLYLEGPKYLVLRDEFYDYKNSYKFVNNLEKILLIFGGSDQANLSSKILKKLLCIDRKFKIDIILGLKFKYGPGLNNILNQNNKDHKAINIYKDANNVSELMRGSDLVITSPGTTMFESFCIGIPTIALYQNKLQKDIFKNFIMTYDLDEIKNFKNFLIETYNDYNKNKIKIDELKVGDGKDEIIRSIIIKNTK